MLKRRISWNRNLTFSRGAAMGSEFKAKGVHVFLGPVIGPAFRVVSSGRNWESFSADPYLAGAMAYETIVGVQAEGVQTSTKVRVLLLMISGYQTLIEYSILSQMSKRPTEIPLMVLRRCPPTLTTRPCMSYIYGMLSQVSKHQSI
jgi:hypothetical protein